VAAQALREKFQKKMGIHYRFIEKHPYWALNTKAAGPCWCSIIREILSTNRRGERGGGGKLGSKAHLFRSRGKLLHA